MKLIGRQSTNIEDRTRDTSVSAPHRNPFDKTAAYNQIIDQSRNRDNAMESMSGAKRGANMKGNPFGKMLKGMNKAAAQPVSPMAKIPIPTPRPDNSKPLPKVLRYTNNKG